MRITHSIVFSLIPSVLIIVALLLLRIKNAVSYILPTILAGLSHLILDLLVGVTPLPLLFPFSYQQFNLPFGILPSAGKIALDNYYFYRNLYLEIGVLIPLFSCLYLLSKKINLLLKTSLFILLFVCSSCFIYQSYLLSR